MNKKTRLMFMVFQILMSVVMITAPVDAVVIDKTDAVGATGTRPLTPGSTLDNFDTTSGINVWGGTTGAWSSENPPLTNARCTASFTDVIRYGSSGYSLKLDYNVGKNESYAGYFSKLEGGSLSPYTTLSFQVRGANGGEFFKIELKNTMADDNVNHAAVYVTDFLDGGVTTSWKKVTIPFYNFANISNWSSCKEFGITFENYQNVANGTSTYGTVYIDNIVFENSTIAAIRIDHFGDKLGTCSLGGNTGSGPGDPPLASYSFSSTSNTYHSYKNGMKIDYDVSSSGSYAFVASTFGGGASGWVKIPQNCSSCSSLTFWIRASSSTKNPEGMKVELHDFSGVGDGEPFYVISKNDASRITTSWKKFTIPLSSFKDWSSVTLDKSRISEIAFTFEESNAVDKTGTVYIDEVQFE